MSAINNFNVLPFYTSLSKQNSKKWYSFGNVYPLASPKDKILPFQIVMASIVSTVSSITIHNQKTGATISSGLTPTIFTPEGGNYSIVYLKLSSISSLQEGRYYLSFSIDGITMYSEIFNAISDLSEYVKLEYWNEDDLYNRDKIQVYFGNDFRFTMYICTDIGKPEYIFEEELTKRLGYKFLESQISNKLYKFTFLAPEYMTDSMRIIRLCDFIKLTQSNEEYNALNFAYDAKWEQQGDLASVECEFETDTIIQKLQSFNRRQQQSFYNALLSNIDEPILFDTEVVAQYYADFQTGGLIQGKLIHELELETELKPEAFIPIDNNDGTPAKKISVTTLTSSSHTHANKPILDLITQGHLDVLSHFSVDEGHIKVNTDLWSTGEVSAYGAGSGAGTGGAVGSLGGLANVGLWADEVPTSDRIMVQLAGATHWSSKLLSEIVGLDTVALNTYLTTNNYATKNYVTEEISKLNIHTHENKTLLDLITQGNIDVLSHLSIVDGRLKADVDFYSTGEVSAYGAGTGTGGGAVGSLGGLANVGLWADEVPASDRIMVQLAGATHWSSKLLSEIVGLDTVALGSYLVANSYAKQSYVDARVAELVGTAPSTLDTLNELAAALGNDPNFATSMSTLIGTKWTQDNAKIANWDSAYNALHSHTNKTELDGITSTLISNWNLAFTNNHTHPNKGIIDSITQANLDVLAKLSIVDGNLKVDTNLWSTGEVSAYGAGSGTGGGGGLISSVLGSTGLGGSYLDSDLANTFNAYTINLINTNLTGALGRIGALETSTPNISWGTATGQYSPLTINSVTRNLSVDGHTHTYFEQLDLKYIQGVDANHRLELGFAGRDYVNWYEYGGLWKFIKRQGETETELFQINPNNLLYKNNTIWHEGNDGAGSGLDADLIDGINSNNIVYGTNGYACNNIINADFNTINKSGLYTIYMGVNSPSGSNQDKTYSLLSILEGSLTGSQLAYSFYGSDSGNLYVRGALGGSFSAWRKIWHDGNFNPSSYLPLSGGTLNGNLHLTQPSWIIFANGQSIRDNGGAGLIIDGVNTINLTATTVLANGNTVWHAGNDGAGSGLDAGRLAGTEPFFIFKPFNFGSHSNIDFNTYQFQIGTTFWAGGNGTGNANTPFDYGQVVELGNRSGNYGHSLMIASSSDNTLYYRNCYLYDGNGGGFGPWKTFAFTDSNVASATKLANTRKIWGQNFNGENNVDGLFRCVSANEEGTIAHKILTYSASPYGLITRIHPQGHVDLQVQRESNDSETFNLFLNANGGNVGIGTTSPSYKLDINGIFRSTDRGYINGDLYVGSASVDRTILTRIISSHDSGLLSLNPWGGNVVIGAPNAIEKLYVNGSTKVNGYFRVDNDTISAGEYEDNKYGFINVCRTASIENASYFSMVRAGTAAFGIGLSTDNSIIIGGAAPDKTINNIHLKLHSDYVTTSKALSSSSRIYTGYDSWVPNSISCSNWFRSNGESGWYNDTYEGGIYMEDTTYVKVYNNKSFWVNGNIVATGEVTAYSASDLRLKTEVATLKDSLRIIELLNPVSYKWNSIAKELNPMKGDEKDYGLIAQELESVMPELVHSIYDGKYKSIDYVKLIPHLICAIKELKMEVDHLKKTYY